jgi:hypothetical protein
VSAILRWHYGKPLTLDPRSKRMRLILRIICGLDVVFVIAFAIAFSSLEKLGGLGPHGDFWLHLIQVIGVLGAIGSLYAILAAVVTWSEKHQWVWYRVWNVLLAFACVEFFWFAYHWHMFNFNLRY